LAAFNLAGFFTLTDSASSIRNTLQIKRNFSPARLFGLGKKILRFSKFPFAIFPIVDIIPEQTLNRGGMVTSVEFSLRGLF
jgi:hypothetical protein